jgi:hypothetical protein
MTDKQIHQANKLFKKPYAMSLLEAMIAAGNPTLDYHAIEDKRPPILWEYRIAADNKRPNDVICCC